MLMPGALLILMSNLLDIPSEESLSLKLSMPGVSGFLFLLEDEVTFLGLVINQGRWAKSKGFASRALVTEGTRIGFAMWCYQN